MPSSKSFTTSKAQLSKSKTLILKWYNTFTKRKVPLYLPCMFTDSTSNRKLEYCIQKNFHLQSEQQFNILFVHIFSSMIGFSCRVPLNPEQYDWHINSLSGYKLILRNKLIAPAILLKFVSCNCLGDCSTRICLCKITLSVFLVAGIITEASVKMLRLNLITLIKWTFLIHIFITNLMNWLFIQN